MREKRKESALAVAVEEGLAACALMHMERLCEGRWMVCASLIALFFTRGLLFTWQHALAEAPDSTCTEEYMMLEYFVLLRDCKGA